MCKESEKKQATTSTTSLPEWLTTASKSVVDKSTDYMNKEFKPFSDERVAGFTGDQGTSFQMLRDFISSGGAGGNDAIKKYMTTDPQKVSTERVVDEGGKLGSIGDYVNPYVEKALQPALDQIQRSADSARKRIAAGATSSGSFGDARHGVQESVLNYDTSKVMGDTAAQFMKNAYDTAMGQRAQDLARFGQVDQTNAQLAEEGLKRGITGAQTQQAQQLQQIQALLSSGAVQQGNEQSKLDAAYQEFLRQYQHDPQTLALVSSILGRVPTSKTQTQNGVETVPDNSLLGLLGAGVGSFAGSKAGSTMIASLLSAI